MPSISSDLTMFLKLKLKRWGKFYTNDLKNCRESLTTMITKKTYRNSLNERILKN